MYAAARFAKARGAGRRTLGQTMIYDYALFGISSAQAAAMRRAWQRAPRDGLQPVQACIALIAALIVLLLAAAYFG
jgi:hypothetical protein